MLQRVLPPLRTGLQIFGLLLLSAAFVGCGSNGESYSDRDNVPSWFLDEPEKENYLYAANSATSKKMQVALDKATTGARGDLASNLETKVESMTKTFTEEVGDEMRQQYVEAQKEITSTVLQGTSPKEKEVFEQEDGTWRAFVLMELPVGKAAEKFLSQIRDNNDEMYTRFRSSQAFKEMQEAVDEYEKEQQQGMSQSQEEEKEE